MSTKRNKNQIRSGKTYSVDQIKNALNAIDGGLSLRQASTCFKVPKSTLFSKLHNHSPLECKKSQSPFFSKYEESEIVQWILYCAAARFPVTRGVLLDTIQNFLIKTNKQNPLKNSRPDFY